MMGRKGPTRHLKRHKSPSFWPISRKHNTWSMRTSTGPHTLNTSMPSAVILRDALRYAATAKEAKRLIKEGKLHVDGKPRLDEKYPVGLMDVVSLPDANENYRVLPGRRGKMVFHPVPEEEVSFKLCRIKDKKTQRGGRTQLNLHDGSNVVIPTEEDEYKVNDVLKVKVPEKEIQDKISFGQMKQAIITGGRSQGETGMIIGVGPEPGLKRTATIRTQGGEDIRTLAKYVFVVGNEEPVISLPGGGQDG